LIAETAGATIIAMNRKHGLRALLIAAAALLATEAGAQNPHASPQGKANAADKAEKAADKADKTADKAADKADKAADKAEKAADKAAEPSKAKTGDDRAARKAREHDAQREKLRATWKAPVSDALRQELRRHAERLARLERIKAVAEAEKDKESIEKATKLIAKENERHDKWMTKNVPVLGTAPAASPVPAAADGKEGAK
jgi:hypothetical protein